jgi:hypothetical protein
MRATCEAHSSNSELDNRLNVCLRTEANEENLCRYGQII